MKAREERARVAVRARMRVGVAWQDVCILNYSQRGLGLTCEKAPERGAYIEIRRGPFVLVARVAWASGRRFGVRTDSMITRTTVLGGTDIPAKATTKDGFIERRAVLRTPSLPSAANSRLRARSMEFAAALVLAFAGGGFVWETASAAIRTPLTQVSFALSGTPPGDVAPVSGKR